MPISVTPESIRAIRKEISKARKDLSVKQDALRKAEHDLAVYKSAFEYKYLLKKGGCKLEGGNAEARKAELEHLLNEDEEYLRYYNSAEQARRIRNQASDLLEDLDDTFSSEKTIYEREAETAEREAWFRSIEEGIKVPVRKAGKEVVKKTVEETVKESYTPVDGGEPVPEATPEPKPEPKPKTEGKTKTFYSDLTT